MNNKNMFSSHTNNNKDISVKDSKKNNKNKRDFTCGLATP